MIHLHDLNFGYCAKETLFTDLNLRLSSGRLVGLLGANGAGKTTLLKLLAGLRFPDSGDCKVLNFSPSKRQSIFLGTLFYLPEGQPCISGSVQSFMSLYRPFYEKFDEEQFLAFLDLFELSRDAKLSRFSFGQTRKFMLSFAFAANSQVLLLDEPTNGLDIPGKSRFRKIVSSALNGDRLIVIATHQIRDIETLIDHYLMIKMGKIVFDFSHQKIVERIRFSRQTNRPDQNVLFHERFPGGFRVMAARREKPESEVDVELLFNAVMKDDILLNTILDGEDPVDV